MGKSMRLTGRGWARLLVVTVLATPLVAVRADAGIAAFAGACLFDVTLSASPAVDQVPDPTSFVIKASGNCVVNEVQTWGVLSGVAGTPLTTTWSCLGGVARGTANFSTGHPSFATHTVELAIVNSGGVLTVAAYLPPVFEGFGTFAPTTATASACAAGQARTTLTYVGPMAFQDPTID